MESDEEDAGSGPVIIQGLPYHVVKEVVPAAIARWALPDGTKPIEAPLSPQVDPWVFFREVGVKESVNLLFSLAPSISCFFLRNMFNLYF